MNDETHRESVNVPSQHLKKIAHINLILAVCAVASVLVLYAWFRWGMQTSSMAVNNANSSAGASQNGNAQIATPEDTAKLTKEYQDALNSIMLGTDLANTASAKQAMMQVSALRVPSSLKTMHVQVMSALQAAQEGKADKAASVLMNVHEQHSWFQQ